VPNHTIPPVLRNGFTHRHEGVVMGLIESEAALLALPGYHKDVMGLAHAAWLLQWNVTQEANKALRLIAPDVAGREGSTPQIVLPSKTSIKQTVYSAWCRKVIRYAPPITSATMVANKHQFETTLPGAFLRILEAEVSLGVDKEPEIDNHRTPPKPHAPERSLVPSTPQVIWAEPSSTTVSGKPVPSHTSVTRHWSDGGVDYQCRGCSYSNPRYRSVAQHYGNVHNTLRGAVLRSMEGKNMAESAEIAALPVTTEPSGDREILDAIRTLVMGDMTSKMEEMSRTVAGLHEQVLTALESTEDSKRRTEIALADQEVLRTRMVKAEADLDQAMTESIAWEKRALKAEGDIATLKSLIGSV
jgi:hypothetical protein